MQKDAQKSENRMTKTINTHQWETRIVEGVHGAKKLRFCKLCNAHKASTGNKIYRDGKEYHSQDARCITHNAKSREDYEEFKYVPKN